MARAALRVLLVDTDAGHAEANWEPHPSLNQRFVAVSSRKHALARLGQDAFDVAVIGSRLSDGNGLDLLRELSRSGVIATRLFLAEETTVEHVANAFRAGACDYLVKPIAQPEIGRRCQSMYDERQEAEQTPVPPPLNASPTFTKMVGSSPAIVKIQRLVERFGPSDQPVLIEGESGTGKELVASALLRASRRAKHPFVTVNCAALPEQLLESEFFGHERGAFTGATSAKKGLFEAADGGTLFIDEIGELAPKLQAKLLRVLEDGSFRRVGSLKERQVDVRLIAATNRNLAAAVASGLFREDLYFRLNVLSVHIPPLRERHGDLRHLVAWFLNGKWTLDARAEYAIHHYHWPGNVRQLRNAIERAKVLADGPVIRLRDLPIEVAPSGGTFRGSLIADQDDVYALERDHVLSVLARLDGNKSQAAQALGIHRRTLYRMLERWGSVELLREMAVESSPSIAARAVASSKL